MRAVAKKKRAKAGAEMPAARRRSSFVILLDRAAPASWILWIIAGALGAWAFGYTVMRGSDLWWHLATGRWIVNHHSIPFDDPWSFTAKQRWVVDAWLTDVIYWLWSRAFGMMSLAVWKWLAMAATFLVIQRVVSRRAEDATSGWLATLFAIATAANFLDIRPQLHSFLCYAILIALVIDRERPHWGIVPLMWIWANLHAGFTLGVVTLPILLLPTLLDKVERKRSAILGIASVAVCLVNPNGYRAFTQPIIYALEGDSPFHSIGEWLPPFRPGGIQSPLYPWAIAVFVVAVIATLSSRKRPIPWTSILLGILTLAMSLKSRRFVPVFALTTPLVVAPTLASIVKPLTRRIPAIVPPAAAIGICFWLLAPYPWHTYAFHYLTAEYTFPVETMNFVETNHLKGKVFSYFNWGGYIHLRTNGDLKVFIDGRASALFTEKTYLDYVKVLGARPGWESVVDNSGASLFLWPRTSANIIRDLAATGKWRLLYGDSVSVLLVRTDHALGPLVPTPDSPYREIAVGFANLMKKEPREAQVAFRKALDAIPWEAHACDLLAQAYVLDGDIAKGRAQTRECQSIFPLEDRPERFERLVAAWVRSRDAGTAATDP